MALLAPRARGEVADLRAQFDRMIQDMWDGEATVRRPAIDVIDEDDAIVVHAELPGLKPDDVTVELQDGVLTIRGEHEETSEEKDRRFVRRERRVGAFARSLTVPAGTDPATISATCADGVLEVRIPHAQKREPAAIEVQAKS